jgi:BirA family transcriptional regulator, biotin operon repressor / biotin---[acetyl-CoA-carboxylase] ligase
MKTLFIGRNAIHLLKVDSTNSYASELLRQTKPSEGTIIYTFDQENGRGQRGNRWQAEPNKNVAFSLILHPVFLPVKEQFLLTKMVSLAVADLMAELLENSGSNIHIKWPNDIYVNHFKIAGILIENSISGNKILSSVIGIGINVNQLKFDTLLNVTSLKSITGKNYELKMVIERLCEFLEARYLQLKATKYSLLNDTYLQKLYRLNEWKNYSCSNKTFQGKIKGVSTEGRLQVELETSEIKEFDLKEISFL